VTGGDIRQKRHDRGASQGALRRPDSPPLTMYYVYTVYVTSLLSSVYPQILAYLPQLLSRYFCLSDRITAKRQNTGGTIAVSEELVGQVEGLVGKFPTTLYMVKMP